MKLFEPDFPSLGDKIDRISMELIQVIWYLPHYLYLASPNKLGGLLARFKEREDYFMMKKLNITYIMIYGESGRCHENGLCTGSLRYLQTHQADYAGLITEAQFSPYMKNITMGPVMGESKCFLIYQPEITIDLAAQGFVTAILAVDWTIWLLASASIGLLGFALSKATIDGQTDNTFGKSIWILFESMVSQSFRTMPVVTLRLSMVSFILFVFLINSIFSASLQTGLLSSITFLKLDSFDQLLENHFTPIFYERGFCRYSVEDSNSPTFRQIVTIRQLLALKGLTPEKLYDAVFRPGQVFVQTEATLIQMKTIRCYAKHETEIDRPFYTSKRPVTLAKIYFSISSGSDKKLINKSTKLAYAAFETGHRRDHHFSARVLAQGLAGSLADQGAGVDSPCVYQTNELDQMITTSLSVDYLRSGFIILLAMGFVSSTIMMLEYSFGPKPILPNF